MLSRSKQRDGLRRELVGVAEVAARLGLTAERVRQLSKGDSMPEPLGELGRRLIWDWRHIEAWARSEGRLDPAEGESRQVARPWRQRPRGALRLVVDEILQWGSREKDVCHVRVWAPPAGSTEAQVVLLGQLQDRVGSVTNRVELVAMAVAARHLGVSWRIAQFYQYIPPSLLDDGDTFSHVTFTIRPARAGWRQHERSTYVRALGAELVDPEWRRTSLDELEHLTGESPRIWATGTYTRALVECDRRADRHLELAWDPERARDLSVLAAALAEPGQSAIGGFTAGLAESQRAAVACLVTEAAVNAYETARQDVATQPVDAAIALRPPRLQAEARLLAAAGRSDLDRIEPQVLWDALSVLRQALIDGSFDRDPVLERQQCLLVRGLRGGWVPLHWADAGVEEAESPREGWGGPIALPEDLITDDDRPTAADPAELIVLLLDTIANYLAENWRGWSEHDEPAFAPSEVVSATGPLSRDYLDQFRWSPVAEADPARLRRLANREELDFVAVDDDGWLVGVPKGQAWFACEWPVSGPPDPSLANCRVRADRSDGHGATPIFLVHPDGKVRLLPSAGYRRHGNSYAWGYGGGGPWDFTAAVVDLLRRACPPDQAIDPHSAQSVVGDLVASPRTPDWSVADLLAQIERRSALARARTSRS